VIHLTRLNGQGFVLNPDLILKAESTPDTVVTLVDGAKFVVVEPLAELSDRVLQYRAQVVATARELPGRPDAEPVAQVVALAVPALADEFDPATGPTPLPTKLPTKLPTSSTTSPTGSAAALAEPVPLRRRRRH
jgi:flagellar protein FlbD